VSGCEAVEMAKKLEFQWYTRLSEFESGKREPNLLLLLRYARAANVSVESLIDDKLDLPE
jgi:transcriptional regulator with XRE-family HTH domain